MFFSLSGIVWSSSGNVFQWFQLQLGNQVGFLAVGFSHPMPWESILSVSFGGQVAACHFGCEGKSSGNSEIPDQTKTPGKGWSSYQLSVGIIELFFVKFHDRCSIGFCHAHRIPYWNVTRASQTEEYNDGTYNIRFKLPAKYFEVLNLYFETCTVSGLDLHVPLSLPWSLRRMCFAGRVPFFLRMHQWS